jgi:hypothetical protein
MSTHVDVEDDRVVVRFTGRQAVMALAREVSVPVQHVRDARVEQDGWDVELGWRVGGTAVPRRLAFGRFRKKGERTFAAVYAGEPALVVELEGDHYNRLVVSVDDAEGAAQRVRAAAAG